MSPLVNADGSLDNEGIRELQTAVNLLGTDTANSENLLWDDLRLSLASGRAAAGTPQYGAFKGNVSAWAFSVGDYLGFDVQLPHDCNVGVAGAVLHPHVHWSPGNSTDTGDVSWSLDVEWANAVTEPDNEFVTLSGSPLTVSQAGAGVAYRHQIAALGSIDASAMRVSAVLMCRLGRVAGGDTFSGDCFAVSVDFHYQRVDGGTAAEYPS